MTKNDDESNRAPPRSRRTGDAPLTPDLQAQIGRRLRTMYDTVLSEPIPDRFARLLDQLDSPPKPREPGDDSERS